MARLHTLSGKILLEPCPSTSRYTDAALGHHIWYDGSRGYPSAYKRLECPARQMVDVIALVNWLEERTGPSPMYGGGETFGEAVQAAVELEGRRFSPLLTARLRDQEAADLIQEAFAEGRREACRRVYEGG